MAVKFLETEVYSPDAKEEEGGGVGAEGGGLSRQAYTTAHIRNILHRGVVVVYTKAEVASVPDGLPPLKFSSLRWFLRGKFRYKFSHLNSACNKRHSYQTSIQLHLFLYNYQGMPYRFLSNIR